MFIPARKITRPFFWSLVLSGFSLLLIEMAVLLIRQGIRKPAFFIALAGIVCLFVEILIFLPVLIRNALRATGINFLFRFTTNGVIYVVLILLIALAAVNTGNNLLYVILAFMIAAISVSGFVSRGSLNRLQVFVDFQEAIFAGEYTTCRLRLENRKRWLPSFSIGVEGYLVNRTWLASMGLAEEHEPRWDAKSIQEHQVPAQRAVAYFPYLPGSGQDSQVFQVRFQKRGLYRIAGIEILTSFPFGFFRKGRKCRTSGELAVYPELLDKGDFQSRLEMQFETMPLLRKGLGSEIYALRPYQPGEDVRFIHWKASARSGQFIVKEFAVETIQSFLFLVDESYDGDRPAGLEKYERAMSFLATLVLELQSRGRRTGVILSHQRLPAGPARQDAGEVLENLARSYLRPAHPDKRDHPFNRTAVSELIPQDWQGSLILCSFQPAQYFFELAPSLDNFLDLGQL